MYSRRHPGSLQRSGSCLHVGGTNNQSSSASLVSLQTVPTAQPLASGSSGSCGTEPSRYAVYYYSRLGRDKIFSCQSAGDNLDDGVALPVAIVSAGQRPPKGRCVCAL